MQRYSKQEPKKQANPRAAYTPPRLTEYGSLARLIRVKGGGMAHDAAGCLNTKTSAVT